MFLKVVQMLMCATLHSNGRAIHHLVYLAQEKLDSERFFFFLSLIQYEQAGSRAVHKSS